VQRVFGDEIGDGSTFSIVMMRMHLAEERLSEGHEFVWWIGIEEPEEGERRGEIVDDGAPTEQRRTLGGDGNTAGNSVFVMDFPEM